jgi:RES domain-containing protein
VPAAWRIVKTRHAAAAFDGEGARQFGGRWNSPGTRMVYGSESLSLAALELLVNLESGDLLGAYTAFPVAFPDGIVQTLDPSSLPANWRDYPPPVALQLLGDQWIAGLASAVLRVPSVVVEHEQNLLLNPAHPHFSRITIGKPRPFRFDPRLRKP